MRVIFVLLLAGLASCSSVSGGKPLAMPTGEFTPINEAQRGNALVVPPTPGRALAGS